MTDPNTYLRIILSSQIHRLTVEIAQVQSVLSRLQADLNNANTTLAELDQQIADQQESVWAD